MSIVLEVTDLRAGYGRIEILRGVDFSIRAGECVALLGPNGAGKTTFANTLAGLLPTTAGEILLDGASVRNATPSERSKRGLGLAPQGRRTFGSLTVEETLRLFDRKATGWSREEVYSRFPKLAERRRIKARLLSGGEQSMLSFARVMITGPRVLVLDEPSEGLAVRIVRDLAVHIRDAASSGVAVLLIEQNTHLALEVADRVYDMIRGTLTERTPPDGASVEI